MHLWSFIRFIQLAYYEINAFPSSKVPHSTAIQPCSPLVMFALFEAEIGMHLAQAFEPFHRRNFNRTCAQRKAL